MATGDVIKLGTFYVGNVKQARPTYPWQNGATPTGAPAAGNIPVYTAGQTIEIRDTDTTDAYKMQWVEVNDGGKKYLVGDRVALVSVSWDDLNAQSLILGKTVTIDGQQYKVRSLTGGANYRTGTDAYSGGTLPNEWDRWIVNEAGLSGLPTPTASDLDTTQNETDRTGAHNQKWNWYYVYSWAQETYTGNSSYRVIRGYHSARNWYYFTSSSRYTNIGFRPVLEVLNSAPVISGSDENLGDRITPFSRNFTVNDTDATDVLTVNIKVNGTIIETINNAVRNQTYTADNSSVWTNIPLNTTSTMTIEASDSKTTTIRTYTFVRKDDRIKVQTKNPIETSIAAKKIVTSVRATVPNGATMTVHATNNAFDASPAWEDITSKVNAGTAHSFANTTKTAAKWGVGFKIEILKGTATTMCTLDAIGFSFE